MGSNLIAGRMDVFAANGSRAVLLPNVMGEDQSTGVMSLSLRQSTV